MTPPTPSPTPAAPAWLRRLTSPVAAAVVLVLFWGVLFGSVQNESVTYDETVHATAGYAYWKYNDYRINPENGNLPQRWAALGLLASDTKFPAPGNDAPGWLTPNEWELGEQWLHHMGNDTIAMLRHGRAGSAVLAVILAALVWAWSRRLFGAIGGMLSLLVCVLNPTLLANGPLMTSDTAAALFFLAATGAWWWLLQRLTPLRLAASALVMGGLFVSKMSAPLIILVALVLTIARLVRREPLPVGGKNPRLLSGRRQQAAALGVAVLVHAAVVYATVWGFYGFRFSMFAPGLPGAERGRELWAEMVGRKSLPEAFKEITVDSATAAKARKLFDDRMVPTFGWEKVSDDTLAELKRTLLTPADGARLDAVIAADAPTPTARLIVSLRDHRVLPESYLFGYLHAWRFAQARLTYFKGVFSNFGWTSFFPYTFLVKTPLSTLVLVLLAIAALVAAGRLPRIEGLAPPGPFHAWPAVLPLIALFGLYWVALLNSNLNIGHRHIMATYPPLFIFCGAAGRWIEAWFAAGRAGRAARLVGCTALTLTGLQAAEIGYRFPHYLAYFNGIVSPDEAYQEFTDSTLDWGQDLPGVKRYTERHPEAGPFFLSYFGNGDPRTYDIPAHFLASNPGRFLRDYPPIFLLPVPAPGGKPELEALMRRLPAGYDLVGTSNQAGGTSALFVKSAASLRLTAGTYLISATMLPFEWSDGAEQAYLRARELMEPLLDPANPRGRVNALMRLDQNEWVQAIETFEKLQTLRLISLLNQRKPDDNIGYSILVYRLNEAQVTQALSGPPPIKAPARN
jgi:hypothetical protein